MLARGSTVSTVEPNERSARRVLLAMLTDSPEVDDGWITERDIRNRSGLGAVRTWAVLRELVQTGAVEQVTSGDLAEVHFRLTGTGVVRAMVAARWPAARMVVWWHRRRVTRAGR